MSKKIRKMITRPKQIFWEAVGERTQDWRDYRKEVEDEILRRKKGYLNQQKQHILAEDANTNFFKHVCNFSRLEKPKMFQLKDLLPDKSDNEAAKCLADYSSCVSSKFDPLKPEEIPTTFNKSFPTLQCWEAAKKIKHFRKPKSMVPGDVFPKLVTKLSDFFAIPLTMIYNQITQSKVWPTCWKREFVTVIPKKSSPECLGDTRNISCTMLAI